MIPQNEECAVRSGDGVYKGESNMNKRYNVCLLVAKIVDFFSSELVKGAIMAAKGLDINLTVMPGNYIGEQEHNDQIGMHYEYQYNVLFDYAAMAHFDYVIAAVGTIGYNLEEKELKKFLAPFGNTPLLCVASPVEGYDHLCFDNYSGLSDAIKHLASQGRKHIGIMAGRPDNSDCAERYEAYRKSLAENGLEYKDSYAVYCDISFDSTTEAKKLLDDNPELDAVICANDKIAAELYKVLHERNIAIGRDIAVVGFDDQPAAKNYDPPLATVKADARMMGSMAVEKAVSYLRGEPMGDMVVSTRFIPRHSCNSGYMPMPKDIFEGNSDDTKKRLKASVASLFEGIPDKDKICTEIDEIIDYFDKEFLRGVSDESAKERCLERINILISSDLRLFSGMSRIYSLHELIYIWLIRNCRSENIPVVREIYTILDQKLRKRYINNKTTDEQSHLENIFIREALTVGMNLKDSYAAILKCLCNLGSQTSYLYLLDKPVIHNFGFDFPDDISWKFKSYSFGANTFSIPENEQKMYTPEVFRNSFLVSDRPRILIASILFTGSTHYGLALLEPDGPDLFRELELITYQLSSAVRTLDILRSLNDHMSDMYEKNTELETESRTDELTRVLNRKGFYSACEELMEKHSGNNDGSIICYTDTDDLRDINRLHGHIQGDFVIKLSSDCLRYAFGRNAVVGRMGGGEFAVMIHRSQIMSTDDIIQRKERFIADFNKSKIKPYSYNMSLGMVETQCSTRADLESALEKACEIILASKSSK